MIISASRRTDIPAYYSTWFINRLREGFLCVRNPMNPHQVSRVSLARDVLDCIVFWTKNAAPMLDKLDALQDYTYYFQFTLTGYGRDIEAHLPDKKAQLIPTFQKLSDAIGPERVIWRYDPILFNERYTEQYHLQAFRQIAEALEGRTEKSVISFVDTYNWNSGKLAALHSTKLKGERLLAFAAKLKDIAAQHGMAIGTCAEADDPSADLPSIGIPHNACIDKNLIERLTGCRIKVNKDPTQRPECMCAQSIDIGAYNTCGHGCVYCYATRREEAVVRETMARYDPGSPILCDSLRPDDRITDRPVKSLLDRQVSLMDMMGNKL